jgi:hypothetical protein
VRERVAHTEQLSQVREQKRVEGGGGRKAKRSEGKRREAKGREGKRREGKKELKGTGMEWKGDPPLIL